MSTPTIDYDALARQARSGSTPPDAQPATGAPVSIDYAALAAQARGEQPQKPQLSAAFPPSKAKPVGPPPQPHSKLRASDNFPGVFNPGDELPEDDDGDVAGFWDTADERRMAEEYNRALDAWKNGQLPENPTGSGVAAATHALPPRQPLAKTLGNQLGSFPPASGKPAPPSNVPQILAEEPPHTPALISTKRIPADQVMPPTDERSDVRRFLETPIVTAKEIDEAFPFLIGPFAVHKGILKGAAGMTSPEGAAIIAGTGGAGSVAETVAPVAARVAQAGLSAYFATQAGKSLLQKSPEMAQRWKAGDWQGVLETGGEQLVDAALGAAAAVHAVSSAGKGLASVANELRRMPAEGDTTSAKARFYEEAYRRKRERAYAAAQQPSTRGEQPEVEVLPPERQETAGKPAPEPQTVNIGEPLRLGAPEAEGPQAGIDYAALAAQARGEQPPTPEVPNVVAPVPSEQVATPPAAGVEPIPSPESALSPGALTSAPPAAVPPLSSSPSSEGEPPSSEATPPSSATDTQIATGREHPIVLQDFVAGRGGFADPARMVIRSMRPVTADEIRQAFFPDLGPDQLDIQKLRPDDFMGAVQPGRQPFILQFLRDGRHTSTPEGIEQRLGLGPDEQYHAPAAPEAGAPAIDYAALAEQARQVSPAEVTRPSAAIAKDLAAFQPRPDETAVQAAGRKGLLTAEYMKAVATELNLSPDELDERLRAEAARKQGQGPVIDITPTSAADLAKPAAKPPDGGAQPTPEETAPEAKPLTREEKIAANERRMRELEAKLKGNSAPAPVESRKDTNIRSNAAAALRRAADGLDNQIEAKRNPGVANQNPTARRARIAGSMAKDADRLETVQKGLRALADLQESGEVPEILKGVRSRAALEDLIPWYDEQGRPAPRRFPSAFIHNAYIRDFNEKLKGKPNTKSALDLLNRRNNGDGVHLRGMDEINLISDLVAKAEAAGISTAKYAKDSIAATKRLYAAGINEQNWDQATAAVAKLGAKPSAPTAEMKIREAERDLIGTRIEGYFPTPKPLAERLVEEADIKPGMSVLEPSAGNGAIADAVREAAPDATLTVVERAERLRKILELKGHDVAGSDFMEFDPARDEELRRDLGVSREAIDAYDPEASVRKLGPKWLYRTVAGTDAPAVYDTKHEALKAATDHLEMKRQQLADPGSYRDIGSVRARKQLALIKKYEAQGMSEMEASAKAHAELPDYKVAGQFDRIVMNPPFEHGQDMDHVRRAFDLLKPGGRMVAIMGEGSFFRSDKKATAFREWLEANGGTSEKLPEGSFTGKDAQRQTGVATRIVIIDKPEARQPVTVAPQYVKAAEESRANRAEFHRQQEAEEAAAAARPDVEPQGKPAEVYTIKGRKVNVGFDVREAGDLVNSFEPHYPQEYQPRDTDRKGSRQRVEQRKGDMNGALMSDSRLASDGAPITLRNGTVITRNHGTQALKELYREKAERANRYKKWLVEHAHEFGLDPLHVSAMREPVLIRAITDDLPSSEVVEFAREANMSSAARMSDAEMADMLSRRMTGALMDSFDPSEDGRPNPEFVRNLIQDLPVEEQSVFQDRDGKVSQTGARIIRNAVFAKAYPDPRALERMAESESPSLKNITSGMLAAAPGVAKFQEAVSRGDRFPLGIGPEIADAAAVIDELVRTGTPVRIWFDQSSMFGRDPVVESLVRVFSDNRRSAKRIGELLKEYTEVAHAAGSPKQETMFGPPETPEKADVLAAAHQRAQERWNPRQDLLAQSEAQAEPEGGRLAPGEDAPARHDERPGSLQSRSVGEPSLFGDDADQQSKKDAESYEDRLLGDQLTAQFKSGLAARPSKLKPAKNRGLFEEEGPEQDTLFARRRPTISPDQLSLFDQRATTADSLASLPPFRRTSLKIDPKRIDRLPEAPRPAGAFPTLKEIAAYWGGAEARTGNLNGRPVLYVNSAGMDVVLRRMGMLGSGESADHTLGLTLAPGEWSNVVEEAKAAAADPRSGGFDESLIRVAQQITGAMGIPAEIERTGEGHALPAFTHPKDAQAPERAEPLMVVQAGKSIPDAILKRIAEEEYDHATQMALPKGLRSLPSEIVETPEGQKAAAALVRAGYPKLNPQSPFYNHNRALIAAEIGARLMRPGRYQELGLTAQEARDLATQYIVGLKRLNGMKGGAIVDQIYEAIEANQAARQDRSLGVETEHEEGARGIADRGAESPGPLSGPVVSGDRAQPVASRGDLRRFLQDEAGTSNVGPLLRRVFSFATANRQPVEPNRNYSGLGAFKDKFVRNLSQLEKAHPGVHSLAVQAATSRAQTSALIRSAAPRVEEALGKDGPRWVDFRRALMESRLRGIRDRWERLGESAIEATDDDLAEAMQGWLPPVLKSIHHDGMGQPPQSPAETAAALLQRQDFDGLREFLSDTFERAGERVARVMPQTEYDDITRNPGFARGLRTYKELFERPIAQNHEENEGVFSDALGPLDTYYPLIPVTQGEEVLAKNLGRSGRAVPYRKPKNIANAFATGHAEDYDPGMEAFAERLRNAFRVNNKAALVGAIPEAGLGRILERGEAAPENVEVRGIEYKAAVVETKPDRQIVTPKGVVFVPAERMVIPAWLEEELRPILDRRNLNLSNPNSLIGRITQFTLAGPLDAVIHSANLMGTLVANTPFLGKRIASKTLGNFPFTKRAAALFQILATDPATEEAARDIQEMARIGVLPEKYGSVTMSKKYAEQTGAELHRNFGVVLYGPKGVDVRARLVMYRLAKSINPYASDKDLYLFVNQLGNYTRSLQGKVERAVKESGWSPFYTAGSTMVRNGVNAWTGQGPMPKGGAGLRALQAITGGAIGLLALWILTHKAYTGKFPWEDPHAKFLMVRLNPEDRQSGIAKALYGPASAGDAYVDLGFFSPLVKRGARALGISGTYDTQHAGGSADQVMEAALTGAIDAAVQPLMGPPAKAAWVGIAGTEPYLTGLRDDRGKPAPQFLAAVKKQKPGAVGFAKQHVLPAVISMNSLFGNLAAATGLSTGVTPHADEPVNHWARMVVDLATPQLFAHASDTLTRVESLAKQRAGGAEAERNELKRQISDAVRDKEIVKARELAQRGLKTGDISADDIRQAVKRARVPASISAFQQLPVAAALEVMDLATPEERRMFLPPLAKKLRGEFPRLPAAEQRLVIDQLHNLHIAPSDIQSAAGQQ